MNRNSSNDRRHTVVIGGSIVGLLAARLLAEHYEQVTLGNAPHIPGSAGRRAAGRHTHALLASGRNVLETLFPSMRNKTSQPEMSSGCLITRGGSPVHSDCGRLRSLQLPEGRTLCKSQRRQS
jgi:2-polyprenyl-6-methoxyphenol hydroxylase-like FAD-dependent oxidoreductase